MRWPLRGVWRTLAPVWRSDAGCAAAILGGALRAASLNVLVNTKAMGAAGAPLTERCLALLARGEAASDAVFKQVKDRLL